MTDPRDLYGLPLDRFTEERNTLARELRRAGRRDEAAAVTKLRKPSVAAWAVNQLVRTQGRAIARLFDAGDGLQRAQSDLVAGSGDASALRDAGKLERASVDELMQAARGLLSSEGHELMPTTLDRVSETLHAAALSEDARAQVTDGCLHRELRHVGLGMSGGMSEPTSRTARETRPRRPHDEATSRGKSKPAPGETASARRRTERERAKELSAARKAEAEARRRAERAARALKAAQDRRDRAADSLRDADAAVASARVRAEEAAVAHRRAQQELDRASP